MYDTSPHAMESLEEVSKCFITGCTLSTGEEVSLIAAKLRILPQAKKDGWALAVLQKISETEFYERLADLCNKNKELSFLRDIVFLVKIISLNGTKQNIKCLCESGITKLIIDKCVEATDTDLIVDIVIFVSHVLFRDNFLHLPYLRREGLFTNLIMGLLHKYKFNDHIVEVLLYMITRVCLHESSVRDNVASDDRPERLVDVLRSSSHLLIDMISSPARSSCVIVTAAVLLYKHLRLLKTAELLKTLKLLTLKSITKLRINILAITAENKPEIQEEVAGESSSGDDNTKEVQYLRDLTYIIRRGVEQGGDKVIRLLMKKGIAKQLINQWEQCNDPEVMDNICYTLQMINIRYTTSRDYLVKQGVILLIPALIEKWSKRNEEKVLTNLIGIVWCMTFECVHIIDEIAGVKNDHGVTIPEILTKLLNSSKSTRVLQITVKCIGDMLTNTMALHMQFTTEQLVDSCFTLIKSNLVCLEHKVHILRRIILKLACNSPTRVSKFLVKHSDFLREQAVLGGTRQLSRYSADIVNKYLCCKETPHKCRMIGNFVVFSILKFVLSYVLDVVLDIQVGYNAIVDKNADVHIRYEGYAYILIDFLILYQ